MPQINSIVKKVENDWLPLIYSHLINVYAGFHLPSHDVHHHLRVWAISKQLVFELERKGVSYNEDDIVQVLIASLFHDVGLVMDSSENHGRASRSLCEDFFAANPGLRVSNPKLVLEAIEKHDDKTLKQAEPIDLKKGPSLLQLITTADDLDAFGYIGVFRYIEIYTIRNVPPDELPSRIMVNLKNRFANFERLFSVLNHLFDNQRFRYKKSLNFFQELYNEILNTRTGKKEYQGVLRMLTDCLINRKMDIQQTIIYSLGKNESEISQHFFENLRQELEDFSTSNSLPHTI